MEGKNKKSFLTTANDPYMANQRFWDGLPKKPAEQTSIIIETYVGIEFYKMNIIILFNFQWNKYDATSMNRMYHDSSQSILNLPSKAKSLYRHLYNTYFAPRLYVPRFRCEGSEAFVISVMDKKVFNLLPDYPLVLVDHFSVSHLFYYSSKIRNTPQYWIKDKVGVDLVPRHDTFLSLEGEFDDFNKLKYPIALQGQYENNFEAFFLYITQSQMWYVLFKY